MENGSNGSVEPKPTKSRRKDAVRVQMFYLRGQLDAAEQTLRNAQRIIYGMFGDTESGHANGEVPAFMAPPKKRRRPRSPEAIARAVATRKANQEQNAQRLRQLERQVAKQGKGKTTAKPKAEAEKPEKSVEREEAHAAA